MQQLGMTDQIKQEFGRELEALKSKLSGQSSEQSQLSRRSSLLSHVTSSIGDKSMDKSVHHELHQLKADMEKLKKTDTAEMGKMINEKVVYLDDKYNKEMYTSTYAAWT